MPNFTPCWEVFRTDQCPVQRTYMGCLEDVYLDGACARSSRLAALSRDLRERCRVGAVLIQSVDRLAPD